MTESKLKRLVIRMSRESLSFSTADAVEVRYENYPLNTSISMAANLREALRDLPICREQYDRTLVMIDSAVLMVPTDIFSESTRDQLYRHTFTQTDGMVVKHVVLPDLNAVAVFSIQKDLCTVLGDHFQNLRYSCTAAPVWRHLHQRSYTGLHKKMYCYFHDRRVEVFSFAQKRFKFCNTYVVNSNDDALYYLLAAWKQLALSAEHDELHLVGDIDERDAFVAETETFIKRVFYINPSGEFNRAAVTKIEGMPYDLMTLFIKGR